MTIAKYFRNMEREKFYANMDLYHGVAIIFKIKVIALLIIGIGLINSMGCGMVSEITHLNGEISNNTNILDGQKVCILSRDGFGIKKTFEIKGKTMRDGDIGTVFGHGNFQQGGFSYQYVTVEFSNGIILGFADYRSGWHLILFDGECCDATVQLMNCK